MQQPPFFQGLINSLRNVPPRAYFLAIPVTLFLLTVAVTLATSGGGDDEPEVALNPTVGPGIENIDAPATATPTARPRPTSTSVPEPTPEPANRADCAAIQGTDYESPEEREWYLANCLGGGVTASEDPAGGTTNTETSSDGGSPGGGTTTTTTPSGPVASGGGEFALGDRVLIPSLGIDASVNGVVVPPSGAMPDPVGYFNFVWYDFSNFGGLGGTAGNGNYVVGCHVDSAVYGVVLCYYVRDLGPGAQIQLVGADGSVRNYTVVSSTSYSAGADFSSIVSSGAADLTIITCTGSFAGGSYDQRHVVQAVLS